ncbi:MAG: hypothetical protein LBI15_12120 [Dysgonamonadaceae bacterium]|jgi:hypothetical protein|nr:hypothetical protein [Dysgonamonadaceae bacterium]
MKKINIVILLLSILLTGCKDEDKDNILDLSNGFLQQTAWEGTITFLRENDSSQRIIGISFITENTGYYEDSEIYPDRQFQFSYRVDGKLLSVEHHSLISGDWFLVEMNKNKDQLVFKQNIHSQFNTNTLKLFKVY